MTVTEPKICQVCGRSFTKRPKETHKQWGKRVGCSKSCAQSVKNRRPEDAESLLERHATVSASGCWEWRGRGGHGYGVVSLGKQRGLLAHRVIYELLVGPIPFGLHLDHLCVNKRCVNPAHLEPVTHAENMRRWSEHRRASRREAS